MVRIVLNARRFRCAPSNKESSLTVHVIVVGLVLKANILGESVGQGHGESGVSIGDQPGTVNFAR